VALEKLYGSAVTPPSMPVVLPVQRMHPLRHHDARGVLDAGHRGARVGHHDAVEVGEVERGQGRMRRGPLM
jgi:hypothetical protein